MLFCGTFVIGQDVALDKVEAAFAASVTLFFADEPALGGACGFSIFVRFLE